MPTAVRSHAKINLGLGIGAPRADGFHALATVYQTLELYDVVTVTARPAPATALRLTSNDSRVPTDNSNTAWKMVALALDALGLAAEVDIHIDKRLPVQGGLGAGSANAVAALVGLETELAIASQPGAPSLERLGAPGLDSETWENTRPDTPGAPSLERFLPLDSPETLRAPSLRRLFEEKTGARVGSRETQSPSVHEQSAGRFGGPGWQAARLAIAAQVGSDVPLFLIGGAILGLDRGQQVYPLPDFEPVWCVVATPDIGVSTPQAFRDWDALCAAEGLTTEASQDKLNKLSRAYASAFSGAIPEGVQGAGSSGVLPEWENLAGPHESALVRTGITSWIENDFERVVFPQHPSLAEIKRLLSGSGTPEAALHASLSGSGSALFGLYLTRGDAEAARERLRPAGVRSTLTRTLPRLAYWSEMLLLEAH